MESQNKNTEKNEERLKISSKFMLSKYDRSSVLNVRKLVFKGIDKDVYNITSPFEINGIQYLAGRVESTDSEIDSKTMFFFKNGEDWILDECTAVIIATNHHQFLEIKDWKNIKLIVDGRNCLDPVVIESQGILYNGIGRGGRTKPTEHPVNEI